MDVIYQISQTRKLQNLYSSVLNNAVDGKSSFPFESIMEKALQDAAYKNREGGSTDTVEVQLNEAAYQYISTVLQLNLLKVLESQNQYSSNAENAIDSIESTINKAAQKYGVDADFIKAVIKQESSFNPKSISDAGASGLMQLMPSTAKELGVTDIFDINQNVDAGTKYLKQLLNQFGGNKELALAAYNGGPGRMKKLSVDTTDEISKMPSETRNYVKKVINYYEEYKL